jgi:hypothetical protein
MVLFFIISLVAAYTSRNLIFEQRTSANMYRAGQAYEAAEAGLEWALAQLNAGLIDGSCQATGTGSSFRDRYLEVQPGGTLTVRPRPGGGLPTCVFDGSEWQCLCPDATDPVLAQPTGNGPFPAFRVRMLSTAATNTRPGTIVLEANGCTNLGDPPGPCLDFPAQADSGEGVATVSVVVALAGGLATPPAAPITARTNVTATAPGRVSSVNLDVGSGGLTLNAGADVDDTPFDLQTLPGTPRSASVVDLDSSLGALADTALDRNRMFASVFGLWRQTHDEQPALLNCASPCDVAALTTLWATNPGRTIRVDGDLSIDAPLGSATAPALLVVTGDTTVSASTVYGVIYQQGGDVTVSGSTVWNGALIGENGLNFISATASDLLTMRYDADVIRLLRRTHGSFVRVPGSWRDIQ